MDERGERVKDYFEIFCMVGETCGFAQENEGIDSVKIGRLDSVKIGKRGGAKATLNDSRQHSKVTGNEDWKTSVGKGEGEVLRRGDLGDNCKRLAIEQGDVDEQGQHRRHHES